MAAAARIQPGDAPLTPPLQQCCGGPGVPARAAHLPRMRAARTQTA